MAIQKMIESDPDIAAKQIGLMVGMPGRLYRWTVFKKYIDYISRKGGV